VVEEEEVEEEEEEMPNLVEVDDPLLVYTRVLPCIPISIPMGIRAAGQRARQHTNTASMAHKATSTHARMAMPPPSTHLCGSRQPCPSHN
jgi:hypothetical protein